MTASSSTLKGSEILFPSGVGTFHRLDSFVDELGGLVAPGPVFPNLHKLRQWSLGCSNGGAKFSGRQIIIEGAKKS